MDTGGIFLEKIQNIPNLIHLSKVLVINRGFNFLMSPHNMVGDMDP